MTIRSYRGGFSSAATSSYSPSFYGGGIFGQTTRVTIILYIILAIALALGIYYIYNYLTAKYKVGYKENSEHIPVEGVSNNECEVLLFSTTWCPHCKSAKPIWEEIKIQYKGKTVNGYTIVFTEVDCTNDSPEVTKMMDRYKIEGFPTIKLLKNGQVTEFDAKVTKENLQQFINTAV